MSPGRRTAALVLALAACRAGPHATPAEPAAPVVEETIAVPIEMALGPHARFPSGWHVLVLEPLDLQVAPERFPGAGVSVVLPAGDRLTRWPIYGAIVERR